MPILVVLLIFKRGSSEPRETRPWLMAQCILHKVLHVQSVNSTLHMYIISPLVFPSQRLASLSILAPMFRPSHALLLHVFSEFYWHTHNKNPNNNACEGRNIEAMSIHEHLHCFSIPLPLADRVFHILLVLYLQRTTHTHTQTQKQQQYETKMKSKNEMS